MTAAKAVFLDKDGTLVEDVAYNVNPRRIRPLPGTANGLRLLHKAGYRLIVVTNQSGIAHGYFAESQIRGVERWLRDFFERTGVPLDGFYYCPHHPDGSVPHYAIDCACRKPKSGMLQRAAEDLDLSLAESWIVGDILDDVEAGKRVGCRGVLINNGGETEWRFAPERLPDHEAASLLDAAQIITAQIQSAAQPMTAAVDCQTESSCYDE